MLALYIVSLFMAVLSIVIGVALSSAAIAAGMWYIAPIALACFACLSYLIIDMWRV
nr:MAG TPA: hypothetical protein [Caudoviricetes sp.]